MIEESNTADQRIKTLIREYTENQEKVKKMAQNFENTFSSAEDASKKLVQALTQL